jgi:hypothetical protein
VFAQGVPKDLWLTTCQSRVLINDIVARINASLALVLAIHV